MKYFRPVSRPDHENVQAIQGYLKIRLIIGDIMKPAKITALTTKNAGTYRKGVNVGWCDRVSPLIFVIRGPEINGICTRLMLPELTYVSWIMAIRRELVITTTLKGLPIPKVNDLSHSQTGPVIR